MEHFWTLIQVLLSFTASPELAIPVLLRQLNNWYLGTYFCITSFVLVRFGIQFFLYRLPYFGVKSSLSHYFDFFKTNGDIRIESKRSGSYLVFHRAKRKWRRQTILIHRRFLKIIRFVKRISGDFFFFVGTFVWSVGLQTITINAFHLATIKKPFFYIKDKKFLLMILGLLLKEMYMVLLFEQIKNLF